MKPDVVLMDIGMAGMSSFEATRLILKERPETKVIFLSMYDDEDYLAECVDIGANGYILKDSPAEQLVTAIREVSPRRQLPEPAVAHPSGRRLSHAGPWTHPPAAVRHARPSASAKFSKCWPRANPSKRSQAPSNSA